MIFFSFTSELSHRVIRLEVCSEDLEVRGPFIVSLDESSLDESSLEKDGEEDSFKSLDEATAKFLERIAEEV